MQVFGPAPRNARVFSIERLPERHPALFPSPSQLFANAHDQLAAFVDASADALLMTEAKTAVLRRSGDVASNTSAEWTYWTMWQSSPSFLSFSQTGPISRSDGKGPISTR